MKNAIQYVIVSRKNALINLQNTDLQYFINKNIKLEFYLYALWRIGDLREV